MATEKSPRPMNTGGGKSPRGGKSIFVKVCSLRNSKKEDLLCRVKYGHDARQTKTQKKGSWDEETSFAFNEEVKTLTVELLSQGLLSKVSLGEAVVTLSELQPGISSHWYPVKKGKDGKDRGEIQLTIDIPKPDKKKISLKETEELLADMSGGPAEPPKKAAEFDLNKAFSELGLGIAQVSVIQGSDEIDVQLPFQSVNVDRGSLSFTFAKPEDDSVSLTVRVPKGANLENEYKQSPVTKLHFVHPKLQLRPAFATQVQVRGGLVGETQVFGALIQSRAISHELKTHRRIKCVFKVDLLQVATALKSDELGDIEKTPETVPGELISAAFKGQLDVVEKCLERGDDVNEGDENQETALHKAVTRGNEAVIKVLVDAGADPRQHNKWGQSAADIAAKFRPELTSLLHSYI